MPKPIAAAAPGDGIEIELLIGDEAGRGVVVWMLAAFVVTFLATRGITRLIRAGIGPFRDSNVGGVHVHHHVYGIFLMIGAGVLEFAYRPDAPWLQVLAAAFGVGVALTLDEFALWLHLEDVYWAREGRKSVDAVLIAAVVGALLVLGANPFADEAGTGEVALAVTVVVNLLFSVVAISKGKIAFGVVGLVMPFVSLVAAIRLAKPRSPWARWFYRQGSRRLARSGARFPVGRGRWDGVKDLLAGAPTVR